MAHVVFDRDQQVGLPRAHQIDVAKVPAARAGERRGPHEAGRAAAEEVHHRNGGEVVEGGKIRQRARRAPAVPGLVEVERDAALAEVDDVRRAAAVDVRESDPFRIEGHGVVEPRRRVHRHLGAEVAVAKTRPVADVAVPDADEIGQAVARHVGEEDRLLRIGEDQRRAFLFVGGLVHDLGLAEPLPAVGRIIGDEDVSEAVAVDVEHAEVGVVRGDGGSQTESREGFPCAVGVAAIEARRGLVPPHEIHPPVAGDVEELRLARAHGRHGGLRGDPVRGCKIALAEVPLVEPTPALLHEDAGNAFAVEVDPPVRAAVGVPG